MVVIESPFSAPTQDEFERNMRYLKCCFIDALARGESPYASHMLFPQVLHDAMEAERQLGMACGFDVGMALSYAYDYRGANMLQPRHVFYLDLGMSRGMRKAAEKMEPYLDREDRHLGDDWERLLEGRDTIRHIKVSSQPSAAERQVAALQSMAAQTRDDAALGAYVRRYLIDMGS